MAATDWDRMVADIDRQRAARRSMTKQQFQRHVGRRMHSGGSAPPVSAPRGGGGRTAAGAALGAAGGAFATSRSHAKSHASVAVPMALLFAVLILNTGVIQKFQAWVKEKTSPAPPGPPSSTTGQQAPTNSLLGPTADEVKACGPDPGTSNWLEHFKWVACVAAHSKAVGGQGS